MLKKDLIVAILLTFCLSVMLFRVLPIGSQSVWDYDPWYDINDDGIIEMRDISGVARKFGAEGDPTKNVTVTNFPDSCDMNITNRACVRVVSVRLVRRRGRKEFESYPAHTSYKSHYMNIR